MTGSDMDGPATPVPRVRLARDVETGRARIALLSTGFDLLDQAAAAHLGHQLLDAAREIAVEDAGITSGAPTEIPRPADGTDVHLVELEDGRLIGAGVPRLTDVRAYRRPEGPGGEYGGIEWTLADAPPPAGMTAVGGPIRACVWRRDGSG